MSGGARNTGGAGLQRVCVRGRIRPIQLTSGISLLY
jgi:hypothetical protein